MKKHLLTLLMTALAASSALAARTEVSTGAGTIYVTPLSGSAIRISATPESAANPNSRVLPSWMDASRFVMTADTYTLNIDRRTGRIDMLSLTGDTLLSQLPGTGQEFRFRNPAGGAWYGGGERGLNLDMKGDTLVMWNRPNYGYGEGDPRLSQMGITMPYVVNEKGYGLLFDDSARAVLTLGDNPVYTTDSSRPVSYTFIGGGSLPGTTSGFTEITGRQDLPPFWALGYITSKYGYHTDAEALGAIDSLKNAGYPVDGLIFDLYWYGKETDMGRLEWKKEQFPDHKGMLDSLRARGVNTVLIHQPYINKIGALDNYEMLSAENLLVTDSAGQVHDVHTWVGDAGMFDISNPATRAWLWERLRHLTVDGVAGWWGDLGEPEQHPLTMLHKNGLGTVDYHNIYGNDWSRLIYEGLKSDFPEMRPFLLMRGGSTGLQKYSVFPWTGDVARSWEGLQPQIKLTLNSGLSGLGYMSSDIGGFAVNPDKPYDSELYVRWMQLGVFSPVLRTHAQNQPEPYHYPAEHDILLDLVKMRYRWLPYNYTLAFENSKYGHPLARPVNYYGGTLTDVVDEYLWGSEVLVAPVMTEGARSREVIFPDFGLSRKEAPVWIDWFDTSRSYHGGTTARVDAPLERFPLFVKQGSFIPQYERDIENVSQYDPSTLTVKYFAAPGGSSYTMFDDNRLSPASLEKGDYQLIRFSAVPEVGVKGNPTAWRIAVTPEGEYSGMPETRRIRLEVIGIPRPSGTFLDGTPVAGSYNASGRTLTLDFDLSKTPVEVEIRI